MHNSLAPFGPWREGLDPTERVTQLRSLAALATTFCGSRHPLVRALRAAERDQEAAAEALVLIDRLPTLRRRQMLAVFGRIACQRSPREATRPQRAIETARR